MEQDQTQNSARNCLKKVFEERVPGEFLFNLPKGTEFEID